MFNFYSITLKEEKKNEEQDGIKLQNNILLNQKEKDLRRVFNTIVKDYPELKSHKETPQGNLANPKYKQQYQSSKIRDVLTHLANGTLDEQNYRLGK